MEFGKKMSVEKEISRLGFLKYNNLGNKSNSFYYPLALGMHRHSRKAGLQDLIANFFLNIENSKGILNSGRVFLNSLRIFS